MAEISAGDVMKLRAMTNAGMMECKRALTESNGDMTAAAELLRKWGAGRADTKMSNEMKEGLVAGKISDDGKLGVMIRLGCQTDFVARNDGFQKMLHDLLELAFANPVSTAAELNALVYPDGTGRTVEAVIKEAVGTTLKENLAVTGLARYTSATGQVGKYVHHNNKVGALVQVDGSTDDAVKLLIAEIAMHVTAGMPFVPVAVSRDGVAADVIEKEKAIAAEGITGKPANIVEKIVAGRLEKFFGDQVLIEQPFVKDDKRKIRDLVADTAKQVGAPVTVARFARMKVGEM